MNRLEHNDFCIPRDFDEYLLVYQLFSNNGINGYRSYSYRVMKGEDFYNEYPNIYWSGTEYVTGTRSSGVGYNLLTVSEFLLKAGIGEGDNRIFRQRSRYNGGNPLKHMFAV